MPDHQLDEYAALLAQKVRERIPFLPDGTDPTRLEAFRAKQADPALPEPPEDVLEGLVAARQDAAVSLAAFCVAFYDSLQHANAQAPRFTDAQILTLLCHAIRGA